MTQLRCATLQGYDGCLLKTLQRARTCYDIRVVGWIWPRESWKLPAIVIEWDDSLPPELEALLAKYDLYDGAIVPSPRAATRLNGE